MCLGIIFLVGSSAAQAVTTLTFEGVGDLNPIGNYYNGGGGPNYGISFGSDSLAIVSGNWGGSGNFDNNPSGHTVAFFLSGPGDVMNVAAGFTTGFSFFYAAAVAGFVDVYSGLNGTGALLATLVLPVTPNPYYVWVPVGVAFSGTAMSAVFGGAADFIGFDDITLGSVIPGTPDSGSTVVLLGGAMIVVALLHRRIAAKRA